MKEYTELEQLRRRLQSLVRERPRTDPSEVTDCALSVLFRLERGDLSPGDLAVLEHVTPPSMNRTLNSLADAGLIIRHRDGPDGRRVRVSLTRAGAECARTARTGDAAWVTERLSALSAEERAIVYNAIAALEQLAER